MSGVVITGVGAICALGDNPADIHGALCESRTAFGAGTVFAEQAGPYRAAEIRDFTPRNYLGAKNLRPLDRTGQLAAVAAEIALKDGGWTPEQREGREIGLVLGTTFCSAKTIGEFDRRAMKEGVEYASPLDFANSVINAAAGQAAIWHRLRGVNSTISTGAASGLHAIGYATQLIRAGRASALIAGGAEELCFESYLGFLRAGQLCPQPGDGGAGEDPRPFDLQRRGCVLGEGAAFLVLEAEETALARGARVIGRIEGFGAAYDSRPAMAERGGLNALTHAVQRALSSVDANRLGAVMTSASGSPVLDAREATAIRDALAPTPRSVPVTSIKGHLGEMQGASGALQTIAMLASLETHRLPPIAGLQQPDVAFDLDFVMAAPRALDTRYGLVTSVAREGNCCALAVAAAGPD
jgi:3-oxoacyl-[acyl-carrier-protein] synthase II